MSTDIITQNNIHIEPYIKIFNKINIFVEIYNKNINESECVIPTLEQNGATVYNILLDS